MADVNLEQARFNMVEQQVRTWEVLDQRVLDTLEALPRERYVPARHRNLAYSDLNLPLGHGEVMLSPKMEGRILQALDVKPDEQALEIGTGSGYLTACLARMGAQVTTVDIHQEFSEGAQALLGSEGFDNVSFKVADASKGWDDGRRFDAIAVTGSLPEMHEGFHRALTLGGRLFLVVGESPVMEALLITRVSEDQWATESMFDTDVPALVNAPRHKQFVL